MQEPKPIHPDFFFFLKDRDASLVELFLAVRAFVWQHYPDSNELLYHTQALTAVFSITHKLSDAYCHIPIYTNHLNLGFNKGRILPDPDGLLQGTGKLIRHIPIHSVEDLQNESVSQLIKAAIELAIEDLGIPPKVKGQCISKIKR